jgi:hypothetical protein
LRSDAAKEWLAQCSGPEEAVALALAKITGHTELKARSLLTAQDGFTTLLYRQVRPPARIGPRRARAGAARASRRCGCLASSDQVGRCLVLVACMQQSTTC